MYLAPNLDELEEIPATLTPETNDSAPTTIDIFPDSGSNICLGGPKQQEVLNLDPSELRPCNKHVKAVGGGMLKCYGWIPMEFNVGEYRTIHPVFFCEKVDRMYY